MSTLLANPDLQARALAAETTTTRPSPGHLADRWLWQAITNEARFTYRLGVLLSATCQGIAQTVVARATMVALLDAMRAEGRQVSAEQRSMLLDQPLWMVLTRRRSRYEPDILLVDAAGRVGLVIEAKGPRAKRQCTPTRALRQSREWASDADALAFRAEVLATDESDDLSHSDAGCDRCWMTNRGAQSGEHISAFHQCDAYRYGRDWLPEEYSMHPDAVWLLLVPARTKADRFFEGSDSAADWGIADVEALLMNLCRASISAISEWEASRLQDLIVGMQNLY